MRMYKAVLVIGLILASAPCAVAFQQPGKRNAPATSQPEHSGGIVPYTQEEVLLSWGVLVLLFATIACETLIITRASASWTPEHVLRVLIVTMIVLGSLFLIAAGYSTEQMSPVIGLLGTVAGYLLGSASQAKKDAALSSAPGVRT